MADREPRRTALVTGASRGIGRAIAASLAGDGYRVGINYRADRGAGSRAAPSGRVER